MGRNVDSLNWTKFPQDETSPIGTRWVKLGEVLKAVAYDQQAAIREATKEARDFLLEALNTRGLRDVRELVEVAVASILQASGEHRRECNCERCLSLAAARKARGERMHQMRPRVREAE